MRFPILIDIHLPLCNDTSKTKKTSIPLLQMFVWKINFDCAFYEDNMAGAVVLRDEGGQIIYMPFFELKMAKLKVVLSKLEIRSLQEGIRSLEGVKRQNNSNNKGLVKSQSDRNLTKLQDPFDADAEIGLVTKELRLATVAEEKSKRVMDCLALALKEVSTEANYAKARLSSSQTELERARSEAERSKGRLKIVEEKLGVAEAEVRKLRSEAEDLVATRNEKEKGFINCMKVSEEENAKLEQENGKLIDSLRISREDNSKLRDVLKHAASEASAVKEALEMARNENSRLEASLSEKEIAYRSIRQEYDCLKVSEAAAVDSVKELKGLLAATSDQWRGDEELRVRNAGRIDYDRPSMESKSHVFDVPVGIVRSSVYAYEADMSSFDVLDRIDRTPLHGGKMGEGASPAGGGKKKMKPVLKRLGEMLSRKSFHK